MFTELVGEIQAARVLFLAPWRELVYQTQTRLVEAGQRSGILLARRRPDTGARVHVTTIQTAARRKLGEYDLVVMDEAHRAIADQAQAILRQYQKARHLGLTATPIRLDGRPLSRGFDDLIEAASVSELVNLGYLVPTVIYGPREPISTQRLPIDWMRRDYKPRAAERLMSRPKLVGNLIHHWRKHANDQPTWMYCCTLAHADHVCGELVKAGVHAKTISGATTANERADLFHSQREGDVTVLVNVSVLTEGVDYPDLRCIVLLRPTLSRGLYLQILGRGLRPAKGKTRLIVLDHADNVRRHGYPDQDRQWSLKGQSKRDITALSKINEPRVVACPFCQAFIPLGSQQCPVCGAVFLPRHQEGMLVHLDPRSMRIQAPW